MLLSVIATTAATAFSQSLPLPATVRGSPGDTWADVELGQRDFTEISEGFIRPNRVKQPAGIAIDRSISPGRLYIWDSGNNRILGMDLATCYASGGTCTASLVIGQPGLVDHGACNLDSSFQTFPERPLSSASTLCGLSEGTHTVIEDKSYAGLFVDAGGNLWVPDVRNHRVLRFDSPFTTDTVADDVWGQADFSGNKCNRATIYYDPPPSLFPPHAAPDAATLCFGEVGAGVTLDAAGNLWVADGGNNRVLRFPNLGGRVAKGADLVLGQHDFTAYQPGVGLDQMNNPSQLRFDPGGNLLVLDSLDGTSNSRVLKFRPPFHNGMSGEPFYTCPVWDNDNCLKPPVAIEIDNQRNGVWIVVNDGNVGQPLLFEFDGRLRSTAPSTDRWQPVHGSVGIDATGDLLLSTLVLGQDIRHLHEDAPGLYSFKSDLFQSNTQTNAITGSRFTHPAWGGVAVAGKQLIVADRRILFWNDRSVLTNGQPADGYVGVASFTDAPDEKFGVAEYGQVKTDSDLRVWVTHTTLSGRFSEVALYQAPLMTGAAPVKTLQTMPVLGGGSITLTSAYGIAASAHSEYLWISEPYRHRVLRVRGPLTATPVVDVILGQSTPGGPERCNRGLRGEAWDAALDMLCYPGAISLDRKGNLFVSDHFLEVSGNRRLLMFTPVAAPAAVPVLMPKAAKLFAPAAGHQFATFEPAFDSGNRMVVGFNPYFSPRFLNVYDFPTEINPANPADPDLARADGQLSDLYGWPVGMTFDADDNLYAYDVNRKLLIYQRPLAHHRALALTFPSEGLTLPAAAPVSVRWLSASNVANVDIEYQRAGTTTWQKVAQALPNTGSFSWTTPGDAGSLPDRLRIVDSSNPAIVSGSVSFKLSATPLVMVYPNGGETLYAYSSVTVRWVSTSSVAKVDIDLWDPSSGNWQTVAHGIANTGSYDWHIGAIQVRGARLRISSAAGPDVADVSDAAFDVLTKIDWTFTPQWRCTTGVPNPAAIRAHWEYMVWPPSPQVWQSAPIDTPLVVHSVDPQSNGYLAMVTDDGAAEYLQPFANPAVPQMGVLPPFLRAAATFRFGSGGLAGIPHLDAGIYGAGFYLPARMCQAAATAAQALTPKVGEVVSGNSTYTVRWTMPPAAGDTVSIELSADNGATWSTVSPSAPNAGTFALSVPRTPTVGARVRVSSIADPAISATSAPFIIQTTHPHRHHRHRHHGHRHRDDEAHDKAKRSRDRDD